MLFIYLTALFAGLLVGWYIGLVAGRIGAGLSSPLSGKEADVYPRCDLCHKKIKLYDLVPVVSFVVLGGRCRECGKAISPFYPLCELLTAALWVVAAAVFGASAFLVTAWLEISLLVFFIALHMRAGRIPPAVFAFYFVLSLCWNIALYLSGIERYIDNALGLVAGAVIFFFLAEAQRRENEKPDYNCMLMMAAFGMTEGIIALLLAVFLGSAAGSLLLLPARRVGFYRSKGENPLLPAMAAGAILALLVHPLLPF